MYIPPRREGRLWPETAPSVSTCVLIAMLNGIIFVAWRYPGFWYAMNRYFVLSAGHPNTFSVLGNIFSHQQSWHLIQNMAFLFALAPKVHEDIGRGNFIALYMSTGIIGALFNLYVNVLTRKFAMASVGASGALCGVLGAFFMLRDEHSFKVPFTEYRINFDTKWGIAVWALLEIVAFRAQKGTVDHLSHLGGMAAGIAGGWLLRRKATVDGKDKDASEGELVAFETK
jgi:rhomboid-like protein